MLEAETDNARDAARIDQAAPAEGLRASAEPAAPPAPEPAPAASCAPATPAAPAAPCAPAESASGSASASASAAPSAPASPAAPAAPAAPSKPAARRASKRKKKSKAAVRKRRYTVHAALRWAVRICFFILAPSLFSAAFDGAKTIFTNIGTASPVELSAFIKLLIVLLAFTILFGRFFCGYACAFGTFGDVMYVVGKPIRRWLKLQDKPLSPKVQGVFQKLKYVILIAILVLCFLGLWPNYSETSPWSAFASLLAGQPGAMHLQGFVALLGVMVCMVLVERAFCQFFCPLGALFAVMPVLPCSSYRRNPERCARSCGMCQASCPVAIYPDSDDVFSGECISCSRCADVCPTCNVNAVKVGPFEKKGDGKGAGRKRTKPDPDGFVAACKAGMLKVRGTGVVWTIVKACLLLALCWYLGVVEYLPGFDYVASVLPTSFEELQAFIPRLAAKVVEWGPGAAASLAHSLIDLVMYWPNRIVGWLGLA